MEKVCFIVPVYNAEKTIEKCLKSILEQDVEKDVFVIDNNSTDNSVNIIKKFKGIKLFHEKKKGPASARNRGLKEAYKTSCKYIAFVDSDVILPKNWSKKAIEILEKDKEIAGVGGPAKNLNESFLSKLFDPLFLYYMDNDIKEVDSLATMNVMFKRNVIDNMFFNEKLIASEDPEFCFRLRKKGYKLILSRKLTVLHDHPQKFEDIIRRWFFYGKYYIFPYLIHRKINKMFIFKVLYAILFMISLIITIFNSKALYILIAMILFIWFSYLYIGLKLLNNKKLVFPFSLVHTLKFHIHNLGVIYSLIFFIPLYYRIITKPNIQ